MDENRLIIQGDCLERMREMDTESVDAIITDPPYGLSFMGKEWDNFGSDTRQPGDEHYHNPENAFGRAKVRYGYGSKLRDSMVAFQEAMTPVFAEALRVARPGAHLLCFGGTRTFHRMTCAIEDAGWDIRDCIMWTYGSGMPKSMDLGRALEKAGEANAADIERWSGWGTCLKPAWEPIIVARKPLDGTVAHNVLEHGVGALNIDACRVPSAPHDSSREGEESAERSYGDRGATNFHNRPGPRGGDERGRFPANLVHDGSDEVREAFGEAAGQLANLREGIPVRHANCYGKPSPTTKEYERHVEDDKCAARFFYCAKANKEDRNLGGVENVHPTVKPNELMRWLVRLVCPKGGLVLDPFCGSGSTGVACLDEGMRFVGIEKDEHYCEISRARLEAAWARNAQMTLF